MRAFLHNAHVPSVIICVMCSLRWDRIPPFASYYAVRIASTILRTARFLSVIYAATCVNATPSLIYIPLKGCENVLFELGNERLKKTGSRFCCVPFLLLMRNPGPSHYLTANSSPFPFLGSSQCLGRARPPHAGFSSVSAVRCSTWWRNRRCWVACVAGPNARKKKRKKKEKKNHPVSLLRMRAWDRQDDDTLRRQRCWLV